MLFVIELAMAHPGVLGNTPAIWLAAGGGLIAVFVVLGLWFWRRASRKSEARAQGSREAAYVNLRRQGEGAEAPAAPGVVATELTAEHAAALPKAPDRVEPVQPAAAEAEGSSVARLRHALEDPDPFVRIAVIAGLIGQQGADDIILGALDDEFPQVRREAVRALGEIGGQTAARALSDVVQGDPSAEVREEAVSALAAIMARRAGGGQVPGER